MLAAVKPDRHGPIPLHVDPGCAPTGMAAVEETRRLSGPPLLMEMILGSEPTSHERCLDSSMNDVLNQNTPSDTRTSHMCWTDGHRDDASVGIVHRLHPQGFVQRVEHRGNAAVLVSPPFSVTISMRRSKASLMSRNFSGGKKSMCSGSSMIL